MKRNHLITTALLSLGLISAASASSTATIGGTNYTVVYITGSTAFRGNVYTAATTQVFDGNVYSTQGSPASNGSTSAYNIYGLINGTATLLSFDFTGSEAGIASLLNVTVPNPDTDSHLANYNASANLPGTPKPTGFVNPAGGAAVTAAPDLAFADTSQAVSLQASGSGLTDYGVVAVIPFEWAKGLNASTTDSSFNDLNNISTTAVTPLLSGGSVTASYLTGNPSDTDKVYLVGRNKGSGTRVNALLETYYGTGNGVVQYAPGNSSYNSASGALTVGAVENITSVSGLAKVFNDGFDSGSGVAGSLEDTTTGLILVGYIGLVDFAPAQALGAVALAQDGVYENDGTVIAGTYPYWGHEHLYGTPGQSTSSPGGVVAEFLTGSPTAPNEGLGNPTTDGSSTAAGPLEASFGTGGGRETTGLNSTQSVAIDPTVMNADKPSGADSGYPTQL
jgi:hypothetical protein